MTIKNKIKRVLFGGLIFFMLGGSPALAEEITPKLVTEQTQKLEQKVSNPKVKITFNYKTESKQEGVEYSTSYSGFNRDYNYLWRTSNTPELTSAEETQVEDVIKDVKDGDINSYEDFVNAASDFSENQKIVLFAAVGDSLVRGSYDHSLPNHEVFSQDIFFDKWQDYLATDNQNLLGVCRHIASLLAKLAKDMEIDAAVVTNSRHAYIILKKENGTAIVDYGSILIMDTKNIEKALEVYQKKVNTIAFQHLFFNDNELKYRLITKDGKNLLNFIGYDESSEKLKNSLTQRDSSDSSDLTLTFNIEDYLTSAEFNYFGFFMKAGEIRGSPSSPMKNMTLLQTGFKGEFSIPDVININPDISFIFGNLSKNIKDSIDNSCFGASCDLSINTDNKEGLNLASRIAGNIFWTKDIVPFYDLAVEAGVSYKIPIKELNIEPYLITQFALFPGDLGTYKHVLKPSEFTGGISFNYISDNTKLSIEPSYSWRIWEQEVGINAKLETKHLGINAGGYMTKSNHNFCPDKYGLIAGLYISPLENLDIKLNYKLDGTNYGGEVDYQSSFNIQGSIKF